MITAIVGWVITSLVLLLVVGKRVYHKTIIRDLREQMLWLDHSYQQIKVERPQLLKLRKFHRRITALIELTKKRKEQ